MTNETDGKYWDNPKQTANSPYLNGKAGGLFAAYFMTKYAQASFNIFLEKYVNHANIATFVHDPDKGPAQVTYSLANN